MQERTHKRRKTTEDRGRKRRYSGGGLHPAQKRRKYRRKNRYVHRFEPPTIFGSGLPRKASYKTPRIQHIREREELKFHDSVINATPILAAGTLQADVCIVVAGVLDNQRIGRRITVKKILWRYCIEKPVSAGGAAPAPDTVRIILAIEHQTNKLNSLPGQVLHHDHFQSFRKLVNNKRYTILMDRTHTLHSPAGAGNGTTNDFGGMSINRTFYKDVNIRLDYDNIFGTVATMTGNNLVIMTWSAKGTASLESRFRIRYSDG